MDKTITGFPSNIRSLYVEQLVRGLELELTVIQAVINSKERMNLVQCAKSLEEALGSGDDVEIAQCFPKIQLDNQKRVWMYTKECYGTKWDTMSSFTEDIEH